MIVLVNKLRIRLKTVTIFSTALVFSADLWYYDGIIDAEPMPLLLYTAYAAGSMLFLYTVAAIINYLAEITDILQRGANTNKDKENH